MTDLPAPAALVDVLRRRTLEVLDALVGCDEAALLARSSLPDWSRLTIACHLRCGTGSLLQMTDDVLAGRRTSYYPQGRATQRPPSLHPVDGEAGAAVVAALGEQSERLHEAWAALSEGQWELEAVEPDDNPDLGTQTLGSLLAFRMTEVEVHGTDLGLGVPDWSPEFVTVALAQRVRRLDGRPVDDGGGRSWRLDADDGSSHLVAIRAGLVTARPVAPDVPADATVAGSTRDLVALLLGRPTVLPLRLGGDVALAAAFATTFPSP